MMDKSEYCRDARCFSQGLESSCEGKYDVIKLEGRHEGFPGVDPSSKKDCAAAWAWVGENNITMGPALFKLCLTSVGPA
jgi:hypothetical protein